ncbi:M48 family metallopeptidase [Alteromonas sp. ASW11-36]|uniref:M48 family metallopeptidase n=1 Tax=Alteromonas arenosi TaxID=3055817 RepID=A0ABT7T1A8_9ALTE|nr:M48 family metallopeptidase [Alteromonas sp. ASW11-36]MDM7862009.1 M48 family metallopeptidase [Alteromonas sp. ASW11-36]
MWSAQFYHDGGSKASAVMISLEGDKLIVTSPESEFESLSFDKDLIQVKSKLGGLPREIILPTKDLIIVDGDRELDAWLDGDFGGRLNKWETNRRWLITSVLGVPILVYLVFGFGIPWFAVHLADYVPQSVKAISSERTLSALDYSVLEPSALSEDTQLSIQQGFREVVRAIDTDLDSYNVQFRQSETFGPNAFALPDGTIVFTDALVDLLEREQRLLDAIFLHEIGHVEQNHSMQMVAESIVATIAISYFVGDVSGAVEAFMGVGSSVLQNRFSQAHEWQADDYAIMQLRAMGRSPQDFADAMLAFAEFVPASPDVVSWFETHPGTTDRIENAERAAEQQ